MTRQIRMGRIAVMGALLQAVLMSALARAEATTATQPPRTIAVLPFKNLKADKQTDWVGEGAAETLTTKLAGVPALVVVERNQIKEVLKEQDFQNTDMTNPASAVKVGQVLGAERIVIGTFASDGGTVMFNVRVADVQSGVVLNTASVTGKSTEIFDTLSKLADAVIQSFDKKVVVVDARPAPVEAPPAERIVLTETQKQEVKKTGNTNVEAYRVFSQASAASTPDAQIHGFTRAIRLDGNYALAYSSRGNAYALKSMFDQAIHDFSVALKLNPNDAMTYYNRGKAHAEKGEYHRAIRDYDRALRLKPTFAKAWFNKGLACDKAQRPREALTAYRRFVELSAHHKAEWKEQAKARRSQPREGRKRFKFQRLAEKAKKGAKHVGQVQYAKRRIADLERR